MLFFFKEKPIEIVAFIKDIYNSIKEFSPIVPARDLFPDWWRNTPSSSFNWDNLQPVNTAKSCPGIIQSLTTGFIMPLWSDLAIQYSDSQYQYQFSDMQTMLSDHPDYQSPNFCEDYWKFKIHSPWILNTPVKLMYTSPFYHNTSSSFPFIIPPAIVPPIKHLCGTQVFIFAKKEQKLNRTVLKSGTPLMHIIPLTESKVTIRCEVVSESEYSKKISIVGFKNSFNNRGLKNIFKNREK